eukprot:357392-Chlamydomonas_euryale.AAC.16
MPPGRAESKSSDLNQSAGTVYCWAPPSAVSCSCCLLKGPLQRERQLTPADDARRLVDFFQLLLHQQQVEVGARRGERVVHEDCEAAGAVRALRGRGARRPLTFG